MTDTPKPKIKRVDFLRRERPGFCVDLARGTFCWTESTGYTQNLSDDDLKALFAIDIHLREHGMGLWKVYPSEEQEVGSELLSEPSADASPSPSTEPNSSEPSPSGQRAKRGSGS